MTTARPQTATAGRIRRSWSRKAESSASAASTSSTTTAIPADDWLEAQLAIIRTEMVTLDQVMLPYMTGDDGRTLYQLIEDRQFALTSGQA